jgi:hypothetical protein
MVERISKAVTNAMIERHAIDPAEREIYEYGFQITFSSVISFFLYLQCVLMLAPGSSFLKSDNVMNNLMPWSPLMAEKCKI